MLFFFGCAGLNSLYIHHVYFGVCFLVSLPLMQELLKQTLEFRPQLWMIRIRNVAKPWDEQILFLDFNWDLVRM